jgi:hypothetical protein
MPTQMSLTTTQHRATVQRLAASGLTAVQIAAATGLPLAVVHELLTPQSWINR